MICRAGIACIVPPEGWEPPFALEKGTNGQSAESFRFSIRKQLTSHLCMRVANTGKATKRAPSRYAILPAGIDARCRERLSIIHRKTNTGAPLTMSLLQFSALQGNVEAGRRELKTGGCCVQV